MDLLRTRRGDSSFPSREVSLSEESGARVLWRLWFSTAQCAKWDVDLPRGPQEVVPVVAGGAGALDDRIERDHRLRHGLSSGIGIKTAADGAAALEESGQPSRIWTSARGGAATVVGMKGKTTESVDSRFTKDDSLWGRSGSSYRIERRREEA